MPHHAHCCVPECSSRREKTGLSFHKFPKDGELRKRWIIGIKRDEGPAFKVSDHTVVCGKHFAESDFVVGGRQGSGATKGTTKRLKRGAVPSKDSPRAGRPPPKTRLVIAPAKSLSSLEEDGDERRSSSPSCSRTKPELSHANLAESERRHIAAARKGTSDFEFYTSFSSSEFGKLWDFLDPEDHVQTWEQVADDYRQRERGAGPKFALGLKDQLVLVLVRLRLGLLERDLGIRFGVSEATVSRTVNRWLSYMKLRLGSKPTWPKWEYVKECMPQCFRDSYPTTFCILDATELLSESPSSLPLQSRCFSSYKGHTTHKGLVAIAPNGCIIFVSELYNGSISDLALTEESGFLELLPLVPRGKSVMADRGFEIQHLLLKHGILLNIPPFTEDGYLSAKDVVETQKIARVRIHVERVIGQVKKTFLILRQIVPASISGSINQIWTVCCLLNNFRGPIIAEA